MRHLTRGALAASLLLLLATAASAESGSGGPVRRREWRERTGDAGVAGITMLRVNGGLASPTGDFGDLFDTGFGAGFSLAYGVSPTVLLSTGLSFQTFDADFFDGDATVIPWTFNIDAVIPTTGQIRPWVGGGLGAYNVDIEERVYVPALNRVALVSESETNFGLNFGMGVGGPMGARTAWGAGLRYHHVFEGDVFNNLDFFTLQFGVGFVL